MDEGLRVSPCDSRRGQSALGAGGVRVVQAACSEREERKRRVRVVNCEEECVVIPWRVPLLHPSILG